MIFNVSYGCWLSLTVSPSVVEFLHVSYTLPWSLAISHYLFQLHGVAACLSLSVIGAGCLSLSVHAPWSCSMSLTVSNTCWLALNFSSNAMELRDSQQQ